jgi:hypothetical protein
MKQNLHGTQFLKFADLLGAFAKLRNGTVSFLIPVCPFVRPSARPHGTVRFLLDGF